MTDNISSSTSPEKDIQSSTPTIPTSGNTPTGDTQQSSPPLNVIDGELNPVTKKIVENAINKVLTEYVSKTKYFTADSLHYIRTNVTQQVKNVLGEDEISFVDVGLDLSTIEQISFFFKIDIPKDKVKNHIIEKESKSSTPSADQATAPKEETQS